MTRAMQHIQGFFAEYADGVTIDQPAVGRESLDLRKAKHLALLGRASIQKLSFTFRAFDRHIEATGKPRPSRQHDR